MKSALGPKVSVITAVYNGEKFIRECIEGILNQTFRDFEYIVINDGSTDRTEGIVREYQNKDDRIRLIKNEKNEGRANARNRGLKEAKGQYIAIMDADDVSMPERLEKEVNFLDSHPDAGIVGTWFEIIDENGQFLILRQPPESDEGIKEMMRKSLAFCHSSVMFRRECVDTAGFYRAEFRYAQDYDLVLRMTERYVASNIPEYLCKYRFNINSCSVSTGLIQRKYGKLAIELAQERKVYGKDSLQSGNRERVLKKIEGFSRCSWLTKRKSIARSYHFLGMRMFYDGNLKKSRTFIGRALFYYPFFNVESWKVFTYLCVFELRRLLRKTVN